MLPLDKDLQLKKSSISEFELVVNSVLAFLPNVLSNHFEEKGDYLLYYSISAGTKKFVRPINKTLFIMDVNEFSSKMKKFRDVLSKIKNREKGYSAEENHLIDSILYTMQQAMGAGFDLLVDPNSARKHVGNRFEELIKSVFTEIGVPNKKVVIKVPYDTEDGIKNYTCENDLILSPYPDLNSDSQRKQIVLNVENTSSDELILTDSAEQAADKYISHKEIVVSVKTTSKDRMGKMFMDKILLEKFVGHNLKVIGIFLNDVQRKEHNNISYTLVSGLFMVYNKFITKLSGVYYLDPPPSAEKEPYNKYIKKFSLLITEDIDTLLSA
jgi:hypothetical protein